MDLSKSQQVCSTPYDASAHTLIKVHSTFGKDLGVDDIEYAKTDISSRNCVCTTQRSHCAKADNETSQLGECLVLVNCVVSVAFFAPTCRSRLWY